MKIYDKKESKLKIIDPKETTISFSGDFNLKLLRDVCAIKIISSKYKTKNIAVVRKKEDLTKIKNYLKKYKINIKFDSLMVDENSVNLAKVNNIELSTPSQKVKINSLKSKSSERYMCFSTSYHKDLLLDANNVRSKIKNFRRINKSIILARKLKKKSSTIPQRILEIEKKLDYFIENNLNTLSIIDMLLVESKYINKESKNKSEEFRNYCHYYLTFINKVLDYGIIADTPKNNLMEINKFFLNLKVGPLAYNEIKKLIVKRYEFRKSNNFKEADKMLTELKKYPIIIFDYSKYTEWETII